MTNNTPTTETAMTPEQLIELLEDSGLPASIVTILKTRHFMLQNLLQALGKIEYRVVERGNRAYLFLVVVDLSGSVVEFAPALEQCIRDAITKLQGIPVSGKMFAGVMGITDQVEGGEVLIPFQLVRSLNVSDLRLEPGGGTPLYDTFTLAMVAAWLLIKLAQKQFRMKLTAYVYLLTDGSDSGPKYGGSTVFEPAHASEMVELLTGGDRPDQVSAVSVGTILHDLFEQLGIKPTAVREIGTTATELEAMGTEMSQSVTEKSQGGGQAGGF